MSRRGSVKKHLDDNAGTHPSLTLDDSDFIAKFFREFGEEMAFLSKHEVLSLSRYELSLILHPRLSETSGSQEERTLTGYFYDLLIGDIRVTLDSSRTDLCRGLRIS